MEVVRTIIARARRAGVCIARANLQQIAAEVTPPQSVTHERGHGRVSSEPTRPRTPFWTNEDVRESSDGRILVLATGHARGRETGIVVVVPIAHLWKIADQRATELRMFSRDDQSYEAAGLPPSGTADEGLNL
jgi:hypothetical protein